MRRLAQLLGIAPTILSIGALCAIVTIAAVANSAPQGKVVRIERPRSHPVSAPLLCEIKSDLRGTCIGRSPRVGEMVLVVDEEKVVAEVEIRKFESYNPRCEVLWNVTTELKRGNVDSRVGRASRSIGVADPSIDGRTGVHKVPESDVHGAPDGSPDERVVAAIDRDGDREADIILTNYRCDAKGAPSPTPTDDCLDIWSRDPAQVGSSGTQGTQGTQGPLGPLGKMKRTSQSKIGSCAP